MFALFKNLAWRATLSAFFCLSMKIYWVFGGLKLRLRVPYMGIVLITHENMRSRVGAIAGKHRLWCPGSCHSLLPFATSLYQTRR